MMKYWWVLVNYWFCSLPFKPVQFVQQKNQALSINNKSVSKILLGTIQNADNSHEKYIDITLNWDSVVTYWVDFAHLGNTFSSSCSGIVFCLEDTGYYGL